MHERDLFIAALEIDDETARREYLDAACAGDSALRMRVERLLIRAGEAGEFLEQPAADLCSDMDAGLLTEAIEPQPTGNDLPSIIGQADDTAQTIVGPAPLTGESHAAVPLPIGLTETLSVLGTLFGRYRVERVLGSGGMGVVYLAEDLRLGRRVALKIPKFDADGKLNLIERFRREARTMASVLHRNLCPIFDVDEQDGTHYLTMAFIDGETLAEAIKKGASFIARQIAELIRKLALALEKAHRAGVIHRDLKPANVMIDRDGEPILMDFGLAWMVHETDARVTQSGAIVGTPAYMSPEQAEGDADKIGAASDIYSLGAMLYELLAGRPIHTGSVTRVLFKLMHDAPTRPSEIRGDVDPKLEAICWKAIARRPEDRFATAAEFAEALASFLDDRTPDPIVVRMNLNPSSDQIVNSDRTDILPHGTDTATIAYLKPSNKTGEPAGSLASRGRSRIVLTSLLLIGLIGVVWGIVAGRTKPPSGDIVQDDKRVAADSAADSTPVKPNTESVGRTGFALEFDGVASYVAIPTLINDEPGPVTLEAWVETNERKIGSSIIANFAGKRFCALCVSEVNWFANDPTLQGFPETPWTPGLVHLAFVIDDQEGRLFVDGKLAARRPRINEMKVIEDKHAWLGTGLFDGRPNYFFRGRIGELRVSKVTRYEQDFTPDKRFDTDENTLALYHFDEGSGDVLKDSSGNGHHGQIVGAKWVQSEVKRPPAADLSKILTSPDWVWTVPVNLGPATNTDGEESSPHFSADGRRLWFQRGFLSSTDRAWISDRESPDKPWMPAKSVGSAFEFSGPMADMFVSRDERTWIFVTWNAQTPQRLFESTRTSRQAEWSDPKPISAAGSRSQFPVLTDDGLTLYLTNGALGDGLYAMSRPQTTAPWSEPVRLESHPNSGEGVRASWVSADGLVLVFHSVRGNSPKHFDLWLTTRPSPTEPWQEPVSFGPTINTSANEKGACLSVDGRELVFESDRPGGFGATDLYVSRRVPRRNVLDVPAAPLKLELGGQLPSVTKATGLKLGDLDGDGDLDLFVAMLKAPCLVFRNDGKGGFTDSGQQLGDNASFAVALGDLDGDGDLDAFVANSDDQSDAIWLNDGRGMFQRSPQSFPPSSSNDVALADVDGDKDLDVVVSNWKGSVEIWINDGAGQFVNRESISRIRNTGIALGDLDGDGDADLVMTCIGGANRVWLNDGRGNFTNSEQSLELDESTSVALGDLDRDGDLDLFLTGNHGNQVWFNDGRGHFRASEQRLGDGKCEAVELMDFDADHDLDAVIIAGGWNGSQSRTVWLNDGQGFFQKGPALASGNSQSLVIGDLDGDGDADVVFGNLDQPAEVWFNLSNQSTIP